MRSESSSSAVASRDLALRVAVGLVAAVAADAALEAVFRTPEAVANLFPVLLAPMAAALIARERRVLAALLALAAFGAAVAMLFAVGAISANLAALKAGETLIGLGVGAFWAPPLRRLIRRD